MNNFYSFQQVQPVLEAQLNKNCYLLIYQAISTPPHLGLLVDGKYFSLTVKGPVIKSIEDVLPAIKRRNVPVLFVRLKGSKISPALILDNLIKCYFPSGQPILSEITGTDQKITCLQPVKEFCSALYHIDFSGASLIFGLLNRLKMQHQIQGYYHLNMQAHLQNGVFAMKKYTIEEVSQRIAALNQIYAERE